jgi:hypothetical protein
MEFTLKGLLPRYQAFRTRQIDFEIYTHPGHDPGCRAQGVEFLRNFCNQYEHAILIFDREGSGRDDQHVEDLETGLEFELAQNGWDDRAAAIALAPELEIWIWSDSIEVDQVVGWAGRDLSLRQWLADQEYLRPSHPKPIKPKAAFRAALRHMRKQPSASLFHDMAQRFSFRNCTDRALLKLKDQLSEWFPAAYPET